MNRESVTRDFSPGAKSEFLSIAHPGVKRYSAGTYNVDFGDDRWKAAQVARLIRSVPDPHTIRSYADVGAGSGGVFVNLVRELEAAGFKLERRIGYDVTPIPQTVRQAHPEVEFRHLDFATDGEAVDLVTLNDVVEHVPAPQQFLMAVAERARYVAIHIPLDDRWSVLLANQYNFRIGPVGHLSFWNPASALTMLTAAGLVPLICLYTPGFLAPSGRHRWSQRLILPVRWLMWRINPGLTAVTVGGVSLGVLCRGLLE